MNFTMNGNCTATAGSWTTLPGGTLHKNCYYCLLAIFSKFVSLHIYCKRLSICTPSSSLLELQPCEGLGLLQGSSSVGFGSFLTVDFCRNGVVRPTSNPQPEGPGTTLHLPFPFDLSGTGGTTRSLHSRQHSSPGHWGMKTSSP
jgi:hypothetical protein